MTIIRLVVSQFAGAVALASGAVSAADVTASAAATAAHDHEAAKARAMFEIARNRCAQRATPDSADAHACERQARADYRARLILARVRGVAEQKSSGGSAAGAP